MAQPEESQTALAILKFLKLLLDLVPQTFVTRPAFPAVTSPDSGDEVDPGPLTVEVSSNRPDLDHHVRVQNADTLDEVDNQLVTFDDGNTGFAIVTIPDPGPPPFAAQDFLITCVASTGGSHQIMVTRPGSSVTVPSVSITRSAEPPYQVGDTVTFTAVATDITPTLEMWQLTDGTTKTPHIGNPFAHTFTAAGTYDLTVVVAEDGLHPGSATGSFGPFVVLVGGGNGDGDGLKELRQSR